MEMNASLRLTVWVWVFGLFRDEWVLRGLFDAYQQAIFIFSPPINKIKNSHSLSFWMQHNLFAHARESLSCVTLPATLSRSLCKYAIFFYPNTPRIYHQDHNSNYRFDCYAFSFKMWIGTFWTAQLYQITYSTYKCFVYSFAKDEISRWYLKYPHNCDFLCSNEIPMYIFI